LAVEYENLVYSLVQIIHNFGAVTVVGTPVTALLLAWQSQLAGRQESLRQMTWLMMAGWLLQILTGIGFGAVSLLVYAQLPDIAGVALVALAVKIVCAIIGIVLCFIQLRRKAEGNTSPWSWRVCTGLGVTALIAAGVLRWYS
jgi:hypothetical protein